MKRRQRLESRWEVVQRTTQYQWLMEKVVCFLRGHKWRTKMYDKFCDRCGETDWTYYPRGSWER